MNANTNLNVLGGILDAMLANLMEHIDKRVEAKVITLTERITALEIDNAALQILLTNPKNDTPTVRPTDDVILRLDKMEERVGSLENCQDNDQSESNRRLVALEGRFSLSILDSDEFREAVSTVFDRRTRGDDFLDPLIDALLNCDSFNDKVTEIAADQAGSSIEEAICDHCSDYDHDDIEAAKETDEDAVTDIIKEYLRNVTVRLDV
jgi:hypothetical protein